MSALQKGATDFFGGYNKNKTDPVFYRENNGGRIAKGRDNIPCIVLQKK